MNSSIRSWQRNISLVTGSGKKQTNKQTSDGNENRVTAEFPRQRSKCTSTVQEGSDAQGGAPGSD